MDQFQETSQKISDVWNVSLSYPVTKQIKNGNFNGGMMCFFCSTNSVQCDRSLDTCLYTGQQRIL